MEERLKEHNLAINKFSIPKVLKENRDKNSPFLIAVEGPNGVGKSTLCKRISKKFNAKYCFSTPDKWMEYDIKKRMIFDASWLSSALYFFSGTMEIKRELDNELSCNDLVIMDRSFWSTLAVNWIADFERIDFLLSIVSKGSEFLPIPDIIIILDADYEVCEARINSKTDIGKNLDQVSKESFFKEKTYYDWLEKELDDVIRLDTSKSNQDEVFTKVCSMIDNRLIFKK
ncbi:thymidylate kinase [Orenia metallireducens]|uniref:Thymidylate kinase n=1 Tax=Orenia metallireducens TaxID=1413210 RepID=A0A285I210_9FIRM|nr:deoxynucleoside kinase [Orenia metallireducens]PRX23228.1 thymidylate kinase [Orenia metallireducens]SNY41907.1 Thymidylate kinase [Orenia metallireducens]